MSLSTRPPVFQISAFSWTHLSRWSSRCNLSACVLPPTAHQQSTSLSVKEQHCPACALFIAISNRLCSSRLHGITVKLSPRLQNVINYSIHLLGGLPRMPDVSAALKPHR